MVGELIVHGKYYGLVACCRFDDRRINYGYLRKRSQITTTMNEAHKDFEQAGFDEDAAQVKEASQ